MKICAACSRELPKEQFSKKQWQLKQRRRCKDCIAAKREVTTEAPNTDSQLPSRADAELKRSWTDEDLFKQPPPREECPICFVQLPLFEAEIVYKPCCGKLICNGCIHAKNYKCKGRRVHAKDKKCRHCLCPFCRAPADISNEEHLELIRKRVKAGDAVAMKNLAGYYILGWKGLRQDYNKAMELWLRAGELGFTAVYGQIAKAYADGEGVERDEKKAKYYYELGAMGGDALARHNLACIEVESGNNDRAVKHYMIAAGAGLDFSLRQIQDGYLKGYVTKDDFEKALRAHKEAKDETKSEQREAAYAAGFMNANERMRRGV